MSEKKDNLKIIAEVGVNHNGSIKLAKKLVDVAKKAGADYVKFQLYKTEYFILCLFGIFLVRKVHNIRMIKM